jgi:hypothetical protein
MMLTVQLYSRTVVLPSEPNAEPVVQEHLIGHFVQTVRDVATDAQTTAEEQVLLDSQADLKLRTDEELAELTDHWIPIFKPNRANTTKTGKQKRTSKLASGAAMGELRLKVTFVAGAGEEPEPFKFGDLAAQKLFDHLKDLGPKTPAEMVAPGSDKVAAFGDDEKAKLTENRPTTDRQPSLEVEDVDDGSFNHDRVLADLQSRLDKGKAPPLSPTPPSDPTAQTLPGSPALSPGGSARRGRAGGKAGTMRSIFRSPGGGRATRGVAPSDEPSAEPPTADPAVLEAEIIARLEAGESEADIMRNIGQRQAKEDHDALGASAPSAPTAARKKRNVNP